MLGFDYSIKPNTMVLGDVEYPKLIHESKPVGMGYGILPHYGLLIEPPFTCLIFENKEKGNECFKHFKDWSESSNDGDAVALSFIEKNDGGYTVCVYPEYSRLTDRCLPKYLQSEVSSIVFVHISFPLSVERISQHYLH